MTHPEIYRRFCSHRSLTVHHALWRAPDHLLTVRCVMGQESYKRFDYRDIQGILVRRTGTHHIWTALAGIAVLASAAVALVVDRGSAFLWGLAAVCALALSVHLWKGPSCRSHLQTAVQTERLGAIRRVKQAERLLALLVPKIEAVQGRLSIESLAAHSLKAAARPAAPAGGGPTPIAVDPGRCVGAMAGLLAACGFAYAVPFAFQHWSVSLLGGLLTMGLAVPVIMCLVRLGDHGRSGPLGRIAWGALAFVVSRFAIGYVASFVFAMRHPGITVAGQWQMVRAMAEISPYENGWWLGVHLYSAALPLLLGALAWRRPKRTGSKGARGSLPSRSHLPRESPS